MLRIEEQEAFIFALHASRSKCRELGYSGSFTTGYDDDFMPFWNALAVEQKRLVMDAFNKELVDWLSQFGLERPDWLWTDVNRFP
jgi:hypothetical protein